MLWRVLMAAKYFSNHTDPSTPDQLRQWAAVFVTGISLFVLSTRHKVSLPTRACRRALPCACCAPRLLQLHPRAAAKLASNQCPTSATGLPYCNLLCNTSRKAFGPRPSPLLNHVERSGSYQANRKRSTYETQCNVNTPYR